MSYADQPPMSTRKLTTIVLVFALHAVVLYLMVTGGYKTIIHKVGKLTVIDITPPPPPPPLPPPPPPPPSPPQQQQPPPMVTPPAIVQTPPVPAPVMQSTPIIAPAPPTPVAAPIVAPPAPVAPKPSQASPAKPRGNPGEWVTDEDYPASAIRDGVEGRTGFKLDIDGSGRVSGCTVTSTSGSGTLDDTACRLIQRRARFTPAKDAAGNGIPSTFASSVRWQIPKD